MTLPISLVQTNSWLPSALTITCGSPAFSEFSLKARSFKKPIGFFFKRSSKKLSRLSRFVKGDLDWIVMKCLEKERARRYETANQLGQELQRFLADEPVQAGPPSVGYRAKKFLRRNKRAVVAVALVALTLVTGIIGTSVGLVKAERAVDEARRARDEAENATAAEKKTAEENRLLARFGALPLVQMEKLS